MSRNKLLFPTLLCGVLLVAVSVASAQDRWLHVRIVEDRGEETVNVNLPLDLVAQVLPMVEIDELRHGRIRIDDPDFEGLSLREILAAVRESPDANFVTVQSPDETVRVSKEDGFLLVRVEEGPDTRVRVRIPLQVVDALFSGDPHELDLAAALQALGEHTGEDLVTIEEDDTTVRVWIDFSESGR